MAKNENDPGAVAPYGRYLTLAEAAERSGAKPRTIQFWTMNGVIECDPETRHGGPGVRRRYDPREVAIAAIVNKISDASVSVGELKWIAKHIRKWYKSFSEEKEIASDLDWRQIKLSREEAYQRASGQLFYLALSGEVGVYFVFKKIGDESWDINAGITSNMREFSVDEEIDISAPNIWGAIFVFNASELFKPVMKGL